MAIDFPDNPTVGLEHNEEGTDVIWTWDGEKWRVTGRDLTSLREDPPHPPGTYVGTFAEIDVDIPTDGSRLEGQMIWNVEDGKLYVWYGPDPSGTIQWVVATPQADPDINLETQLDAALVEIENLKNRLDAAGIA